KLPYMLIVGDEEKTKGTVSLRARKEGNLGAVKTEEFIKRIKEDIKTRT
ncbi:MAG: hypothetical protein KJ957_00135, partial [Candidatus Omnitrophica bacterium]|nr:hypothetical protein [Candidatus Omnitrophota bacterium]